MKIMKNPDQNYGMDYALLSKLDKTRCAAPSALPQSPLVWGFTAVCVAADFLVIRTMTNKLITESSVMVTCTALITALLLDVPMSILGNVLAQCAAGLRKRREGLIIMVISLAAFAGMFASYACLRISERDVIAAGATGLIGLADSAEESRDNLPVAIFMAFLPLFTSMTSFGLGLAYSHPRKERLSMLMKQRTDLQEQLTNVNAALAECADLDAEILLAEKDEEAQYQEFLRSIDIQAARLKQAARLLLMVKMKTPEAINILTGQAQALCWQEQALYRQEPALLPASRASRDGGQPLPEEYIA